MATYVILDDFGAVLNTINASLDFMQQSGYTNYKLLSEHQAENETPPDPDQQLADAKEKVIIEIKKQAYMYLEDIKWKKERYEEEVTLNVTLTMTQDTVLQERQDIRTRSSEMESEVNALIDLISVNNYQIVF